MDCLIILLCLTINLLPLFTNKFSRHIATCDGSYHIRCLGGGDCLIILLCLTINLLPLFTNKFSRHIATCDGSYHIRCLGNNKS
jgi:hypothetical protein